MITPKDSRELKSRLNKFDGWWYGFLSGSCAYYLYTDAQAQVATFIIIVLMFFFFREWQKSRIDNFIDPKEQQKEWDLEF